MNSSHLLFALMLAATGTSEAFALNPNFTITLEGDDAEALYVRLEKKEYDGDGLKRMTTKVGQNVLCTKEKVRTFKHEYKCSLSFNVESGELHEMYPIGEDDKEAGLKSDEDGYQGKSVVVKKGGEDSTLTIHGIRAQELFVGMTKVKEEPARIRDGKFSEVEQNEKRDGNQDGTTVMVKKGIHVTCFRSTYTLAPLTECTITLAPKTGKAKPAGEGGMNEKKEGGDETPPAPPAEENTQAPAPPATDNTQPPAVEPPAIQPPATEPPTGETPPANPDQPLPDEQKSP
jgi:hypothetical protein